MNVRVFVIIYVLPGFSLANWAGQRYILGFRSISTDWTVATGTVADIAGGVATAAGAKPYVGWAITFSDALITYLSSRPEWQMREAVFNQFNQRIWWSHSRDDVDSKFNFAMRHMDGLMSSGLVGLGRAEDIFGSRAFGRNDRIWRYDPLTGRYRHFNRNDWYFHVLACDAEEAIASAEEIIRQTFVPVPVPSSIRTQPIPPAPVPDRDEQLRSLGIMELTVIWYSGEYTVQVLRDDFSQWRWVPSYEGQARPTFDFNRDFY